MKKTPLWVEHTELSRILDTILASKVSQGTKLTLVSLTLAQMDIINHKMKKGQS